MPNLDIREVRRKQLIEATLRSIDEVGLSSTTLASVAQRASLSVGIVSHYFGDKSGLLETTMRYVLRDLSEAMARCRAEAPDEPQERLRAIVSANFDDSQINGPVMKTWLSFWSQSMHDPSLRRLQRVNTRRLLSNLTAEFARVMPRLDARRAATGLAALIDGLWLRGALSGGPINTKLALRITQEYVDALLGRHGT